MIARTWHGITEASKADEYLDYLNKTGVAQYRAIQGNLGVYVLCRIEGSDMEKAKYYSEDEQFLLELEPTVTHYEVMVKPPKIPSHSEGYL